MMSNPSRPLSKLSIITLKDTVSSSNLEGRLEGENKENLYRRGDRREGKREDRGECTPNWLSKSNNPS
jgi:hypothetical protein